MDRLNSKGADRLRTSLTVHTVQVAVYNSAGTVNRPKNALVGANTKSLTVLAVGKNCADHLFNLLFLFFF